jgi:hypothetical protein
MQWLQPHASDSNWDMKWRCLQVVRSIPVLLLQYRGSKAKTASKKGTRVGQAAKKQRGQKRDTTGS